MQTKYRVRDVETGKVVAYEGTDHPEGYLRAVYAINSQALDGSDNAESDPQDNSGECGGAYAEELNKAIDSEKIPMTDSSELDNSGGEG